MAMTEALEEAQRSRLGVVTVRLKTTFQLMTEATRS